MTTNSNGQTTMPATLTTNQAAAALNRKPRTLNRWAWTGKGPIKPVRVHGRLAWPADQVAALLKGEGADND
jgi:hypothetical protein